MCRISSRVFYFHYNHPCPLPPPPTYCTELDLLILSNTKCMLVCSLATELVLLPGNSQTYNCLLPGNACQGMLPIGIHPSHLALALQFIHSLSKWLKRVLVGSGSYARTGLIFIHRRESCSRPNMVYVLVEVCGWVGCGWYTTVPTRSKANASVTCWQATHPYT